MNRVLAYVAPVALIVATVACGGSAPAPAAAPVAEAVPATPAGVVTLLEPIEGAMGGHIDMFRWSAVEG